MNQSKNQEAWLFTMATDELTLFSNRLAEDLPEDYKILQQQSDDWSFPAGGMVSSSPELMHRNFINKVGELDLKLDFNEVNTSDIAFSDHTKQLEMGSLYKQVIDAFLFSTV